MINRLIRPALLAAALTAGAGGAQADANLNCDAYAGAAVNQQAQNLIQGCGYVGLGWSDNFDAHKNWCLRDDVGMANLTNQDQFRAAAIAQCANKKLVCENYALVAANQARFNVAAQCGYNGPRWSEDVAGHRAWCMGATPEQSAAEQQVRAELIHACSG